MNLDAVLHIIGFGFVIAMWLAAMLGIGEICRKLRLALNEGQPADKPAQRPVSPAAMKGRLACG